MSIEVREEKPSERCFLVSKTWDYMLSNGEKVGNDKLLGALTEAELRELVEKGARALGATEAAHYDYWRENTRLRAWLKRWHDKAPTHMFSWGNLVDETRQALAGEEAPKP